MATRGFASCRASAQGGSRSATRFTHLEKARKEQTEQAAEIIKQKAIEAAQVDKERAIEAALVDKQITLTLKAKESAEADGDEQAHHASDRGATTPPRHRRRLHAASQLDPRNG